MDPRARKPDAKVGPRITARRGAACGHPSAHQFYSFRTYEEALREREMMVKAPEMERVAISPLVRGRPTGWTWSACPDCYEAHADEPRG